MTPPTPPAIRVLSWNIRKGRGPHGRRMSFEELEEVVATQAPDVLMLQEIDHAWDDAQLHQTDRFAERLGMHAAYEINKRRRTGHHGNATFTRAPQVAARNVDLSVNRIERRGVLHVEFRHAGHSVHVFNTHLGLTKRQRVYQVNRIAHLISETTSDGEAVMLGGDFNDFGGKLDALVHADCRLESALAGLPNARRRSWPSSLPLFSLDRLYLRGLVRERGGVLQGLPWKRLSDHLPIRCRLRIVTNETQER